MWTVLIAFVLAVAAALIVWLRVKFRTATPIGKQPPSVGGLSNGLAWLRNPTQFLIDTRKRLGDIFLLQVFGIKLFFVFSAEGLKDFYNVPETDASFTEATKGFLGGLFFWFWFCFLFTKARGTTVKGYCLL
jgi:hypothetical protein